jgi:UDP-GlcNAc3NAcA epimerase
MRVTTVVGARPQFVKAAVVSRAIARGSDAGTITERIVHTGQHFDASMSDVFFTELGIPAPAHNLGIGGGTHGQNTGRMIEAIERVLLDERPDWVLVYGDTDSTVAAALAAVKLHIPLAHVEAGLRSFNRRMPEEINRVLTDHASDLLLTPTTAAVRNLDREGISGPSVRNVGDVMFDAALEFAARAASESDVLERLRCEPGAYILATVHRQENTDSPDILAAIIDAFAGVSRPVVWPMHPRTRRRLKEFGLELPPTVTVTEPLGYLDMVQLEKHARLVATDSGGVQKEAYFHGVPCVTMRGETEWVELVDAGWNVLVPPDSGRLAEVLETFSAPATRNTGIYGDGRAAGRIVTALFGGVTEPVPDAAIVPGARREPSPMPCVASAGCA